MGQWLSWVKSNEKIILGILDDLAKKAAEMLNFAISKPAIIEPIKRERWV